MKPVVFNVLIASLVWCGCGPGGFAKAGIVQDSESEVFKRAFWKRPTQHDSIVHAHLQEWTTETGDLMWQWFIVVEASDELFKDIIIDNAFSLVPGDSAIDIEAVPVWFKFDPDALDALRSPIGNLKLFFSREKQLIYATDRGEAFQSGVPPPDLPKTPGKRTGRLPSNGPPP